MAPQTLTAVPHTAPASPLPTGTLARVTEGPWSADAVRHRVAHRAPPFRPHVETEKDWYETPFFVTVTVAAFCTAFWGAIAALTLAIF